MTEKTDRIVGEERTCISADNQETTFFQRGRRIAVSGDSILGRVNGVEHGDVNRSRRRCRVVIKYRAVF